MVEHNIKSKVVGVDISNELTTYAIVDVRGNILAESSFPTSDYDDVNNFVAALSENIITLVEANVGYENIRSIGLSAPSASSVSGCIENAANLPWKGIVPMAAMLRDRLGLAVALSNDAHVSALGEYTFGSAHGMKNFIIISLGVGLGSCFFTEGADHVGHLGYAGEFGHTCVTDGGRVCGCGHQGCLEAYAGAAGIIRTAQEVFKRTGYVLGLGLANYASIIDPEAIILTGGISHAGKWLLDSVQESFEAHVFGNMKGKVKIFISKLNDRERDVLGASALAWSVPEYSLFK